MSWQATLQWQDARQRAKVLQQIRSFFIARDVVEVETPLLSQGTITDLHLDAFSTRYDYLCEGSASLYMQTSPEFAMKRLLASGYGDIFQLCKAFRDEAHGSHHNPEFTILEWYRLGFDHFQLMSEVGDLLEQVLACKPATKISYQQVFLDKVNIDPLETSTAELLTLIKAHDKCSDWLLQEQDIDTLLQFVFSEIIEPEIGLEAPCLVYHFPASQASLAKISADDSRVAERFECYYLGLELANGFNELTDAEIQTKRFHQDNAKRLASGKGEKPLDERFICALEHGLPDCAGVALGVDRLVMLALKKDKIKNVLSFAVDQA
ncbi:elongation factor P--(R)-beta-lysine ligase [Thalassomonas actiniarum]|uniref:Elongation factor P--(R)-beta-lysine ligase n=1 Tax=Thalassomonas actiniarum TaxID=485447 RepID=A0AAE9YWW1_9GAMM|nr:elongation factor P--(R)-beta-lysine ligase [Thalassomonas actiniarum]WDE02017.1 elongation factor P--(R)-beta-lysine ligase [Thalassomonas actiniarum]